MCPFGFVAVKVVGGGKERKTKNKKKIACRVCVRFFVSFLATPFPARFSFLVFLFLSFSFFLFLLFSFFFFLFVSSFHSVVSGGCSLLEAPRCVSVFCACACSLARQLQWSSSAP